MTSRRAVARRSSRLVTTMQCAVMAGLVVVWGSVAEIDTGRALNMVGVVWLLAIAVETVRRSR